MNEFLLILQLLLFYGMVVLTYYLFHAKGLLCWTVMATVAANIEVLIQVDAFGMSMTLGNILFASTFIVTDILSEVRSKEYANKAVSMGVYTSFLFLIISQSWLLFQPNGIDFVIPSIRTIFSNTPRLMITSLVVYAIVQRFDVWLYHKIWHITKRACGSSNRYLWLRNNVATIVSQLLNTVLYNFGAFYGVFGITDIWQIIKSSLVIFIVTSLIDTPVVYICRAMHRKRVASVKIP